MPADMGANRFFMNGTGANRELRSLAKHVSLGCEGELQNMNATVKFKPSWESLRQYTVPEWYRDAKFGIFIHWGVYSVPALCQRVVSAQHVCAGHGGVQASRRNLWTAHRVWVQRFHSPIHRRAVRPGGWAELFRRAGRAMSFRWQSIMTALRCMTAVSPSGTLSKWDRTAMLSANSPPPFAKQGLVFGCLHASLGALVVYEWRDGV